MRSGPHERTTTWSCRRQTTRSGGPSAAVESTLIGSGFTPNGSATYTYDGLNRPTQVSLSDGSTVQYTWDAAGNLASITITGQ